MLRLRPAAAAVTTAGSETRLALLLGQARAASSYRTASLDALPAVASTVRLAGWLQSTRRLGAGLVFAVLRDHVSSVQLSFPDPEVAAAVCAVPVESAVSVLGDIVARPAADARPDQPNGMVEVAVREVRVHGKVVTSLPFLPGQPATLANEDVRLQHRYLDLRRRELAEILRLRSRVTHVIHQHLQQQGFLQIETPLLFRSTAEGAREFLVPTRTPGTAYALPQSPQQYKQLLMVGGLDRYYQVARCFRDEGQRADRQPEFTQLDLEMSWVDREDVYQLVESLLSAVWAEARPDVAVPRQFPRMTFHTAMTRYGVDKPDTRFPLLLQDASRALEQCEFRPFRTAAAASLPIAMLHVPGIAASGLSDAKLASLLAAAEPHGPVVPAQVRPDGSWKGPLRRFVTPGMVDAISACSEHPVAPGDLLLFAASVPGDQDVWRVWSALGRLRLECHALCVAAGLMPPVSPDQFHFLWVTDFPMFERNPDGTLSSSHHPFTAPDPQDLHRLASEPTATRSLHYDCVVNGVELGGGSIRIHDAALQQQVLEQHLRVAGPALKQFQHLLQALQSGAPPHGGIAFGLDRLVAVLAGVDSIRQVIAFPKTASGRELLTGAPSAVSDEQLAEYHLCRRPPTSS